MCISIIEIVCVYILLLVCLGALDHFASIGYDCPRLINPADYFIDIISIDPHTESTRQESQDRVHFFQSEWDKLDTAREAARQEDNKPVVEYDSSRNVGKASNPVSVSDIDPGIELLQDYDPDRNVKKTTISRWSIPFYEEFWILLDRNIKVQRRDKVTVIITILQSAVIALLIGFTFFRLSLNQNGIQARVGVLFFIVINICFVTIQPIISLIPLERRIIVRERYASTYRTSTFFLSKSISLLPLRLLVTLLFGCIIYYLVRLTQIYSI